ncbi:MAG: LysE family translocator [Alphaproteobacteria bacterium]
MTGLIFLYGIFFGLVLAAPVGPVGVLCVQRTLTEGRMHGLLSGLGAAVGDGVYGVVAAFGVGAVSGWITGHQPLVRSVGGVLLLVLAAKSALTKPKPPKDKVIQKVHTESLLRDFLSTFFLAITNPITLIVFAGLMAGLGDADLVASTGAAVWLVLGVVAGSALWWLALSAAAGYFRAYMDHGFQHGVNRVSAVVLGVFGLAALWSAWQLAGG